MDLLLTAFGIHTDEDVRPRPSIFYRMPPTSLALRDSYLAPDYTSLLLADRIILDENTYERLTTRHHWSYNVFSSLIRALHAEGFVRLENYSTILANRGSDVIECVERDLQDLDAWRLHLQMSVERWSKFVQLLKTDNRLLYELLRPERNELTHGPLSHLAVMHNDSVRGFLHGASVIATHLFATDHDDEIAREILRSYLTYVETNLILSQELEAPFYDWSDYAPFYSEKLNAAGREYNSGVAKVHQLFEVALPELAIESAKQLLRILQDKRITELRRLIADAVHHGVALDRDFAVRTALEVVRSEQSIGRYRSVSSYALLPLGFVPFAGTPLQKLAEEMAALPYERRVRSRNAWFYLLTEAKAVDEDQIRNGAGS